MCVALRRIILRYLFSLPDLQVKVSFPSPTDPTYAELECHSRCGLAGYPPYIWFINGQNVGQGVNYRAYIQSEDRYSCAVEGHNLRSPLVCKSIPRYTDMTPDVMDLLGYRTTCYYEQLVQSLFKTGHFRTGQLLCLLYCCLQLSRASLLKNTSHSTRHFLCSQ